MNLVWARSLSSSKLIILATTDWKLIVLRYLKTGNQTLLSTIQTLHETDMLRNRQNDGVLLTDPPFIKPCLPSHPIYLVNYLTNLGSYWYYVYRNVTTQDGLFSIPAFHSTYAREFDQNNALAAYQTSALQFSNIVDRCLSHSTKGLLYHGYDPTCSFPVWGNLSSRGHSQRVWARSVGWTCTGLLTTLEAIPDIPSTFPVRSQLHGIFVQLMSAIVRAQDSSSGAWWQVMDFPGRQGNFLESSATGLFAYNLFRGLRLGLLGTEKSRQNARDECNSEEYRQSAERAYDWLVKNAVIHLEDGTLGYNLTVDVCSINSTTAFEVSKWARFELPNFHCVVSQCGSILA